MRSTLPVSTLPVAALLLAGAALSACVVVPLDPHTGQPYGPPPGRVDTVTILQPPVAPAPPQPRVLTARLYPINAQANHAGQLTATVVDAQGGRGSFTLGYAGHLLQGEATRVDSGYAAFGRVHAEVLGTAQRPSSGQRGIANGYGSQGVNVQCEYLMTGPGIGTGACLFSDGAKYQMHFGQ